MAEPHKSLEVVVIKDIHLAETHLKLKSAEDLFTDNLFLHWLITVKCCADHGSDTTIFSTEFQKDGAIKMNVTNNEI